MACREVPPQQFLSRWLPCFFFFALIRSRLSLPNSFPCASLSSSFSSLLFALLLSLLLFGLHKRNSHRCFPTLLFSLHFPSCFSLFFITKSIVVLWEGHWILATFFFSAFFSFLLQFWDRKSLRLFSLLCSLQQVWLLFPGRAFFFFLAYSNTPLINWYDIAWLLSSFFLFFFLLLFFRVRFI